jgi:threonine dehydrogenase-like Zn-dependent dehydrogenase
MGPICANGVLHAAAEAVGADVRALGDGVAGRCVLVYGGGVVGALTALFARRHGAAEVAVADASAFRRERLERLGLTALLAGQGHPERFTIARPPVAPHLTIIDIKTISIWRGLDGLGGGY